MKPIPHVSDLELAHGVTWGELAGLEPRLNDLLWQARAAAADCGCREDAHRAFAPFRDAVADLVGFRSRHRGCPVLGSVGAYEVAYWRLHEAVAGLLPRPGAPVRGAREATSEPRATGRGDVAA
jgi:hypothetical protein